MEFTLIRKEEPVTITQEDGTKLACCLKEITGEQRNSYTTMLMRNMKTENGKPIGFRSYDGIETDLIIMSLYKPDGKTFTKKEVDAFPSTMQKALFEAAQKLSGMDAAAEEEAKND